MGKKKVDDITPVNEVTSDSLENLPPLGNQAPYSEVPKEVTLLPPNLLVKPAEQPKPEEYTATAEDNEFSRMRNQSAIKVNKPFNKTSPPKVVAPQANGQSTYVTRLSRNCVPARKK